MNKTLKKLAEKSAEYVNFQTDKKMTWCGGCGNYGIQNALMRALVLEDFKRRDILMCFDVGCSGNESDKFEAYTIHGLHGRVIPMAAGAAMANRKIKVIASAGDGATFSEGVNHLVHGVRNDYPILFIHHNNENYGLTTGQASALTPCGQKMTGTPGEVVLNPINSLDFVLTLGPSFVARGFSGEVDQMTEIFRAALKHKGFAFVEVLQSCPTYNKATPDDWYASRVKSIESLKGYDRTDIWQARKIVQDQEKNIYTGVLYLDERRKDYMSLQKSREGIKSELVDEVRHCDVHKLF